MSGQKWEYKVVSMERWTEFEGPGPREGQRTKLPVKDESVQRELNKCAAEGWELVSALPLVGPKGEASWVRCILRKPVED